MPLAVVAVAVAAVAAVAEAAVAMAVDLSVPRLWLAMAAGRCHVRATDTASATAIATVMTVAALMISPRR